MNNISKNLYLIEDKINKACNLYHRKRKDINLICVSKTISSDKIIQAIENNYLNFGENYINESYEKWPEIKDKFPQTKLHFIGHLQSNKAKIAIKLFDFIHSIDSKKLAKEIAKESIKQNKKIQCFIQVNIGQEPQKNGIAIDEITDFLEFCQQECQLNIVGLMCIPPNNELAAPYFALLAKIAKKHDLPKLSMGMTSDFDQAIALGATHIRIGTAIFGPRQNSNN